MIPEVTINYRVVQSKLRRGSSFKFIELELELESILIQSIKRKNRL